MLLKIHRKEKKCGGTNLPQIIPGKCMTSSLFLDLEPSDQCSSIEYNSAIEYTKNFFQSFLRTNCGHLPLYLGKEKGKYTNSQELLDIASELTWIPRDLNYHHGPPHHSEWELREIRWQTVCPGWSPSHSRSNMGTHCGISSILGSIKGKILAWQLAKHSYWLPALGSRGHYGWKGQIESPGIPGNCQV